MNLEFMNNWPLVLALAAVFTGIIKLSKADTKLADTMVRMMSSNTRQEETPEKMGMRIAKALVLYAIVLAILLVLIFLAILLI